MTAWSVRTSAPLLAALLIAGVCPSYAETRDMVTIRGQQQRVYLYGSRGGDPVVVSSGDGGWIHLGVHVAEVLAAHGYFVVGFDARAYLSGFTGGGSRLQPSDVPGDYQVLTDYAARGSTKKPILIGVSEGAGLSVLAASDAAAKRAIAGVIGLGLPDVNELGWRWRDSVIYLTHGTPNEPSFHVTTLVDHLAPTPLVDIQSTRDEFVPLTEAQHIFERASQPKQLWVVPAEDHRFSGNLGGFDQRLLEAVSWVRQHQPQ